MRVGLVGCVKSKQDRAVAARELYTSPLFLGRKRAVELSCDRWFILSALHGLLRPDEVIEPYDLAMANVPRPKRRAWSANVLEALERELGPLDDVTFEIHAGADYADHGLAAVLRAAGAQVEQPTAGMSFGKQRSWYGRRSGAAGATTGKARSTGTATPTPATAERPRGGRYAPLATYLQETADDVLTMTFGQVESVLGRDLPASARNHRAWWANGGHTQADAWLGVGHRVDAVDLGQEWVRFRRATS